MLVNRSAMEMETWLTENATILEKQVN